MKTNWYKRKDGTHVLKQGNFILLEIVKRPHGGWCCFVFDKGTPVAREGYHGTCFKAGHFAVRWGCKKAKELNIFK